MLKIMKKIALKLFGFYSVVSMFFACESSGDFSPNAGVGVGGSTATFTIVNGYLYVVNYSSLKTFNISNPQATSLVSEVQLNTTVETIFPLDNQLFIGTRTGMFIYSLEKPEKPAFVSMYSHVVSCDPVVADKKYAYVTLRSGTGCNRGANMLDIIDISDIKSPKIIKSYPMENPHGLGIDGNLLFITEGKGGLKVFDRSNPLDIKLLAHKKDINALDVIPMNKNLILTGTDGVVQYDYSDVNDIKVNSTIFKTQ
jgi:hypothetical protein